MKTCTKCGQEKPFDAFNRSSKAKDGYVSWCRACKTEYNRTWRAKNQEKVKAARSRYYENSSEKFKVARKRYYSSEKFKVARTRYYKNNPEKMRSNRLKGLYGITLKQYKEILKYQGWCCAICGAPDGVNVKRHGVDHDHQTGMVRGILCVTCNLAIERNKNDQKIKAYLANPPAQQVL